MNISCFKHYVSLVAFLVAISSNAQRPIIYRLDLSNIQHHELRVSVEFSQIAQNTLTIQMPNTSPGRYALHNFAKNVYDEVAYDQNGKKITLKRLTPFSWSLAPKNGYAKFEYTLFGNHADGTYAGIDIKKLHLNGPASFIYAKELAETPIQLILNLSDRPEWEVATQLQQKSDSIFEAPNYYYFLDSPIMAGKMVRSAWEVDGQTIEVAMMHEGTNEEFNAYVDWVKKIVNEERRIFGELPKFDFGKYTFLCTYNPWVLGDGMEHRNSTVCSSKGNLAENGSQLIGTIAHEFFHAWNVERIRPRSLEPFKFDQGNVSGELWFGEGFTNYYDEVVLTRTGIQSPEMHVQKLTGALNYVMNFPGRKIRNPIQMSQNATFTDAGVANDPTNFHNTFVTYYVYGEVLGMCLDLMIRSKFDNLTLDDYMRSVWKTHGVTERSYDHQDLHTLLSGLTNKPFADIFFAKYIYNNELPDVAQLLSTVGIAMTKVNEGKPYLGPVKISDQGIVESAVFKNTPLYQAGVEKGTQIKTLAGKRISSYDQLKEVFSRLEVGKEYEMEYVQLEESLTGKFTVVADPTVQLTLIDDAELDPQVLMNRKSWMGLD